MLGPESLVYTLSGPQFASDLANAGPTFVYTWDGDRVTVGEIEIGRVRRAFSLSFDLDDGGSVIVCKETMVLIRSGGPRFVEDLPPQTSLLPLYLKIDADGYLMYQEPGTWHKKAETTRDSYRWRKVSRMVAEWKLGRRCAPGDIVSFIDENRENCHPTNLKIEHKAPRKPKKKSKFAEPIFVAHRFIKRNNHKLTQVSVSISRELFSIKGLETTNLVVNGIFISVDSK